jgi:hypothetical protein
MPLGARYVPFRECHQKKRLLHGVAVAISEASSNDPELSVRFCVHEVVEAEDGVLLPSLEVEQCALMTMNEIISQLDSQGGGPALVIALFDTIALERPLDTRGYWVSYQVDPTAAREAEATLTIMHTTDGQAPGRDGVLFQPKDVMMINTNEMCTMPDAKGECQMLMPHLYPIFDYVPEREVC